VASGCSPPNLSAVSLAAAIAMNPAGLSTKLTVVVIYTFTLADVSPPLHMTCHRFCAVGSASTLW
jgi:hypothetical protein